MLLKSLRPHKVVFQAYRYDISQKCKGKNHFALHITFRRSRFSEEVRKDKSKNNHSQMLRCCPLTEVSRNSSPKLRLMGFTLFNGNGCKSQLNCDKILEVSLLFQEKMPRKPNDFEFSLVLHRGPASLSAPRALSAASTCWALKKKKQLVVRSLCLRLLLQCRLIDVCLAWGGHR